MPKFPRIDEVKFFIYLDRLKKSGKTNMFGATSYLMRDFSIPQDLAKNILSKWITAKKNKQQYYAR